MYSLLIVEDEAIVALSLKFELESLGYTVVAIASTEQEAVDSYIKYKPELILMDINLESGGSGIEAAKKISAINRVPIIYLTAYANDDIVQRANEADPIGYIVKPYNIKEVSAVIKTAIHRFDYEKNIARSEARLRVALDAADLTVWEFNPLGEHFVFTATELLEKYFGQLQQMSIDSFLNLVNPEDQVKVKNLLESGKKTNTTVRMRSLYSQEECWLEVFVSDLHVENGEVRIGAMKDVTSLENYLREFNISTSIFNQLADGILVFNHDCKVTRANPAFCNLIGYEPNELLGMSYDQIIKHSRQLDVREYCFEQLVGQHEVIFTKANKQIFYALTNSKTVHHRMHNSELVMVITDITNLKKAEQKLADQVHTDELTGMYNRTFMKKAFVHPEDYFESAKFTVFFVDLDSFKLINDTYGHQYGDSILQEFAWRLRQIFRNSDKIIRHGGDEFVVLLDGVVNQTDITNIARSIQQLLSQPFTNAGNGVALTASIGIAEWDDELLDHAELMKRADMAMYVAKNAGKNAYRFYDANMGESTQYRLFLEQGLNKAIENDALQMWLQPIVNNRGNIVSSEALCRWIDPIAGFISPDDFIRVAEDSWLIFPLGELMLRKTCAFIQQLHLHNKPLIKVSVNLSAKQLANQQLPQQYMAILKEYGVTTKEITFEITETALGQGNSASTISSFRQLGFSIALDDFGRGYSSLEKLQQFALDIIKIDKAFIDDVLTDPRAKLICDSMISLCTALNIPVVVEGIETQQQSEYFANKDNINQQGYYHSKPVPAEAFVQLLDQQNS